MTIPLVPSLEGLLVAVLVGFLIGLDRERVEVRKGREMFAGVRTFPLIALSGAIAMILLPVAGAALLVAAFAAIAAIAVVAYLRTSAAGNAGATTEMAAFATFLLGALAGEGQFVLAGAAGVTVAILLVAKPRLESFSHALTGEEVRAALELAVITVIVLPLLPNQGLGPWQVLNPFAIWLLVVLVSALSFAGFVASRLLGERRGLAVTGAVGGLVSSTAVTFAMAERSRADEGLAAPAASAAVLASCVMSLRMAVLGGVVNAGILPRLLPVIGAMAVVGGVAAWWLGRRSTGEPVASSGHLTNPFSLRAAFSFGVVFALILLGVRAAQEYLGNGGVYAASAISGLADVDAVTIAFSRLGPGADAWRTPAAAVTLAAVVNTLVKLGLGVALGAGRFRRHVAVALGMMAVAGAAAGAVVYLRF
jgi:uncharacterized membrane protein (DUF4010 family)